ncbi:putative gamma-soluble NSF attachment protein [Besnoitia besnoiti]|uniref:Gamma-soluble NSF attachment protein n=1 Tax=Besnoitia besnoiti TaxID=94643 RepID=A0A2A9MJI0_BESBE|nr:putative gamma-soluble NSF attachment protein [Besnoitia besnoiti]PFH36126.1 putative gamma-soluble NSF attachment protein [Besnoitia besnoiti]
MSWSWGRGEHPGEASGFSGRGKFAEGVEHLQQAEKALKTSLRLLKFSPDYDVAALEYRAAAECFQQDGSEPALPEALHCWQKVVEIADKQQDSVGAARALEQMASLRSASRPGQLQVDFAEVIRLQGEAAHRYRLAGKSDAAVRILQKSATFKEEQQRDGRGAAEILNECVSIYDEDEKWHYASEVYRDLIDLLARERMYTDLLKALDGHIKVLQKLNQQNGIYKAVLSKVIVCLTMGDAVGANNALSDEMAFASNFMGSREFQLAADAVDAYKQGDSDALADVLANQTWSFLSVEIFRMSRDLKLERAVGLPPCAASSHLGPGAECHRAGSTAASLQALPVSSAAEEICVPSVSKVHSASGLRPEAPVMGGMSGARDPTLTYNTKQQAGLASSKEMSSLLHRHVGRLDSGASRVAM